MKVMIRKTTGGALSLYMPKKDLEERILSLIHISEPTRPY